ncbi:MAG: ROK family protein [Ignavibacteriales bacterium]|nr:ROK family protein [Ignavibacteriales bacterium]
MPWGSTWAGRRSRPVSSTRRARSWPASAGLPSPASAGSASSPTSWSSSRRRPAGARYEAVGMGTPGTYSAATTSCTAPRTRRSTRSRVSSACSGRSSRVPLVVENDANCLGPGGVLRPVPRPFRDGHGRHPGHGHGLGAHPREQAPPRARTGTPARSATPRSPSTAVLCECGRRGCGEAYLSGPSLGRRYAELAGETLIRRRRSSSATKTGDPHARRVFEESFRVMGELFANCVNALDLEAIVLGGGVSNIPLWYENVPPVMNRGPLRHPRPQDPHPESRPGGFGGRARRGLSRPPRNAPHGRSETFPSPERE